MASFATNLLPAIHKIRAIPGLLGVHPHTVTVVQGSWSGDHTGDGTETTTEIPIVQANGQPPHVRWASNEEIAVGQLHRGTCIIGPMTPQFTTSGGGGTSFRWFGTDVDTGDTVYLRITGPHHPNGALYRLRHVHQERATQIMLEAEPVTEKAVTV